MICDDSDPFNFSFGYLCFFAFDQGPLMSSPWNVISLDELHSWQCGKSNTDVLLCCVVRNGKAATSWPYINRCCQLLFRGARAVGKLTDLISPLQAVSRLHGMASHPWIGCATVLANAMLAVS